MGIDMNETVTKEPTLIRDVLADPSHEAHSVAKEIMEKLSSGEISLCGCLGPMYGEPYCPCQMKQRGLQAEMDGNPLRIAEDKRADKQMDEFEAKGGWKALLRNGKKQ
jgi:hypothetical protein